MTPRLMRLLTVLLTVLMLQGCAEIVVASGAAIVVTAMDPRPVSAQISDPIAAFQISQRLDSHRPKLNGTHITSTIYNHVLLLTGEARTLAQKQYATQVARGISGINTIHNRITISQASPVHSRTVDASLTRHITAQLQASAIDTSRIQIVTERRTVYLMGLVNHREEKRIVAITGKTRHVIRIIALFQDRDEQA